MGKAKKRPTPSRRVHEAAAPTSHDLAMKAKLSVNDAFHLLQAILEPHAARKRLELAIQTGEVRLWCNDKAVDPNFFETCLRIAARTESDGRWIADIEPTRALAPGEYVWTISRAELKNLSARAKRNIGGAPRKFDREQIFLQAIAVILDGAIAEKRDWLRLLADGLPRNDNNKQTLAALCEKVAIACEAIDDEAPGDTLLKELLGPLFNRLMFLK
jgi:hypothetical protein